MTIQIEPRYLKICTLNLNGLKNKRLELIDFTEKENIDVLLLQETWLKGEKFSIPNFIVFRNDRTGRIRGGTMILIKKNLISFEVSGPHECNHIESTFVKVKCANGYMRFGSVYCSPSPTYSFNGNCFQSIFDVDTPTIIGGDLNAVNQKWGCRRTNPRGRGLYDYANALDFNILAPDDHTHIQLGQSLPELLDIFLVRNTPRLSHPEVRYDLSSDHLPVLLEMGNIADRNASFLSVTKVNWPDFVRLMKNTDILVPDKNSAEIDNAIVSLTNSINETVALVSNTSTKKFSKYGNLGPQLKNKITRKNRLKNLAYRTGDPLIKQMVNNLTQQIKTDLMTLQSSRWDEKVEKLSIADNSIFKMTRALTKGKRTAFPAIRDPDTNLIVEKQELKIEVVSRNFKKQFEENPVINIAKNQRINRTIQIFRSIEPNRDTANIQLTNNDEIKNIIKSLKTHKAPGLDVIKNIALKNLPDNIISSIRNITNSILISGYFPEQWKKAKIILIPKTVKNRMEISNYRPISLLSCLGKIVEKIIQGRIDNFTTTNNVLPDEQFGFRKEHCTVRQTTRLYTDITKNFNKRASTGAVFFDISKAFDRVWHNGLILKLIRLGMNDYLIRLVSNFLHDRSFVIFADGYLSKPQSILAGVPQGSPLAPTLYNLYTHDFPKFNLCKSYIFADDTAITASSRSPRIIVSRLTRYISLIEQWLSDWQIKVNPDKTVAIFFTKSKSRHPVTKVKVAGQIINWAENIKYLGLTFNRTLNWANNTDLIILRANKSLGAIYPLINYRSKLDVKTKINLYKSIIRPVLTYGAATWCLSLLKKHNKLQIFQNKILRIILKSPRYVPIRLIHREAEMPTLVEFLKKIITDYYKRADLSRNHHILDSHVRADINKTYKYPRDWLSII